MKKLAIILLGILILVSSTASAGRLTPGLESQIRNYDNDDMVKVLVVLTDQADIKSLNLELYHAKATKAWRHRVVLEELKQTAARSQDALLAHLESGKAEGRIRGFTPHWLVNAIVVNGTVGAIRELADRDDVDVIEADLRVELIEPLDSWDPKAQERIDDGKGIGTAPGLLAINADRVWNELSIDGTGVIIGGMDTGVDGTHVALASRWQGNFTDPAYAWQDAVGLGHATPQDNHGHGSHTMGTMVGLAPDDTIGVCPGATWIASNVIYDESTEFDNKVIAALEWFSDPDGNPGTVDDMPEVVQNSWGVNESFTGYVDCDSRWWTAIDNCEATGVVLVWSAGNEGSDPETLRSPADRADSPTNCFSVGSTIYSAPYTISYFSSRGPSGCGGAYSMKPEVVAPGSDIYSVSAGGGYTTMSGTSMAGPHVAGVVGLMRAANPNVDVITIKEVLMATAVDLGTAGEDQDYGHGIIDAYEAVLAVADGFGFIEGVVTDSGTSLPIDGVSVTVVGEARGTTSDATGFYRIGFSEGSYTLEYRVFGYLFATQAIDIIADTVVGGDIALNPAPTVRFYGYVYDPVGAPLDGASVTVLDTPLAPVSSGATGYYEIDIPSGGTYDIQARYPGFGRSAWSGLLDVETNYDFHLPVQTADDFETGDFGQYPWAFSGDADWFIDTTAPWEGTYCARAGVISHSQTSTMELTLLLPVMDEVSFYYKVDSESGYDYLRFYVDGAQQFEWAGSVPWAIQTVSLDAGVHVLTWTYSKDGSVSTGSDTAWLDFVEFPADATSPRAIAAWSPADLSVAMEADTTEVEMVTLGNDGDMDMLWNAHVVGAEVELPMKYEELVLPKGVVDPRAGRMTVKGSGGPDTFGYRWKDSDEATGPVYDWVEINAIGTEVPMGDEANEGPFSLGFDFPYYGTTFSSLKICSNGWLTFDSITTTTYANQGIPTDTEPNNLLALFWDDLNPGTGGSVYYYADAANQRFIVEYDGVYHYGSTDALTYQAILSADGDIVFQYKTVLDVAGCTVGIENGSGTDGLEVCFNADYLHDELAIALNTVPPITWLNIDPDVGSISAAASTEISATFDSEFLELGEYTASIVVETSDTANSTIIIPVALEVEDNMSAVGDVPGAVKLFGAVPNPFNPATNIVFSLPCDGYVDLAVYDVKGRLVRTLLAASHVAGDYQVRWNGDDNRGRSVASGTYYVRLEAANESHVSAVALVR